MDCLSPHRAFLAGRGGGVAVWGAAGRRRRRLNTWHTRDGQLFNGPLKARLNCISQPRAQKVTQLHLWFANLMVFLWIYIIWLVLTSDIMRRLFLSSPKSALKTFFFNLFSPSTFFLLSTYYLMNCLPALNAKALCNFALKGATQTHLSSSRWSWKALNGIIWMVCLYF